MRVKVESASIFEGELEVNYATCWSWYASAMDRLKECLPHVGAEEGRSHMWVVDVEYGRGEAAKFVCWLVRNVNQSSVGEISKSTGFDVSDVS